MTRASLPGITKSKKIAEDAAKMYQEGLSIESVASELKVSYRCARKAIRVKGRTSPKRKKKDNE